MRKYIIISFVIGFFAVVGLTALVIFIGKRNNKSGNHDNNCGCKKYYQSSLPPIEPSLLNPKNIIYNVKDSESLHLKEINIPFEDVKEEIKSNFPKLFNRNEQTTEINENRPIIFAPSMVISPSKEDAKNKEKTNHDITISLRLLFLHDKSNAKDITITPSEYHPYKNNFFQSCLLILSGWKMDTMHNLIPTKTKISKKISPSDISGYNWEKCNHPGIEDVRLFRLDSDKIMGIGNIAGKQISTIRQMAFVTSENKILPSLISPFGMKIEKNWMPVIGKDGCLVKCDQNNDGSYLFLQSFASSTFIFADVNKGGQTNLAATLFPKNPTILNRLHLCTQVIWIESAKGYLTIFHKSSNYKKFAFALYSPDGPDNMPGSRIGLTKWCKLPKLNKNITDKLLHWSKHHDSDICNSINVE